MTQAVSVNKPINIPFHFGVSLWKKNFKYAVLSLCMSLLGLPLILVVFMAGVSSAKYYIDIVTNIQIYIFIGVICTIIGVMSGANTASETFRHLYDKQTVDMELSLPLSAKQRFFSGYLSGLGVYIGPFIVSQIISLILLLTGHLVFDGREFQVNDSTTAVRVFDGFGEIAPLCVKLIIGGITVMTMYYTMWVMTMTFCGSKTETWLYGIGANLCMPALYAALIMLFSDKSLFYGLDPESIAAVDSLPNRIFSFTSPIGLVYSLYMTLMNTGAAGRELLGGIPEVGEISFFSIYSFGGFIVKGLLMILIFLAAAYFLYRRRKAEDTGKTFVVRGFYYFVLTCMIIFLLAAMYTMNISTVPAVILSAVVYIILDSISNRGVKKLWLSVIRYAVTAGAVTGIFMLAKATGLFGAVWSVPDVSSVACAELKDYMGYAKDAPRNPNENIYRVTSPEAIAIITDAHRTQLDGYKSHSSDIMTEDPSDSSSYLTTGKLKIVYHLKGGGEIIRTYFTTLKDAREKLLPLEVTEDIKENRIHSLENFIEKVRTECKNDGRFPFFVIDFNTEYAGDEQLIYYSDADMDEFLYYFKRDISGLTLQKYTEAAKNSELCSFTIRDGSDEYDRYFLPFLSGYLTETYRMIIPIAGSARSYN